MPQPLLDYFKKYLLKKGSTIPGVKSSKSPGMNLSQTSIKNYVSDVNVFLSWLTRSLQKDNLMAENITPANIQAYQEYLLGNLPAGKPGINPATAQRHMSSLRCFGQFLVNSNRLSADPTKDLINPKPTPTTTTWPKLIQQYQDFLKHENLSASTIKNYVSDLNNYLAWDKQNPIKQGPSLTSPKVPSLTSPKGPSLTSPKGPSLTSPKGPTLVDMGAQKACLRRQGQTLSDQKQGPSFPQKGPTLMDKFLKKVGPYWKITDNNLNSRSTN